MLIVLRKCLEIYVTECGKAPFIVWLESLDKRIRYRVKERLNRLALGNFGDHKYIANGVSELRLPFGSGYRIYYGEKEGAVILLLCGGDKSTQNHDIKKATKYLEDYLLK
jgi:putative addiction module killer protein